jgi:hypothetical protein
MAPRRNSVVDAAVLRLNVIRAHHQGLESTGFHKKLSRTKSNWASRQVNYSKV